MTPSHIQLTRQGPIAHILLQAPGRNALTLHMQTSLRAALAELAEDPELRLLVLRGADGTFCSGAALDGLQPVEGATLGESVSQQMQVLSNRLIADLRAFPHPTLAVVEGAAAGAGASLALAVDLTLATEEAFFLFPFAPKLGLVPDLGASWILPERLGQARAMGVALLGGRLSAAQARDWGLIWECLPKAGLETALTELCAALATAPPHMAPALRALFAAAHQGDLEAQLAQEATRQRHHLDSPAFEEGRRAFLEKRPPRFEPPS